MHDLHQQVIVQRLEKVLIAFFVLTALFAGTVYLAAPSIYTQVLLLEPSPADCYPLVVTLFLAALLVFISVLIVGVIRHWRWLFWLLLVAFGFSILQIPATILQLMGVTLIEVAIAVWMIQIYRQHGVWAMGKKKNIS